MSGCSGRSLRTSTSTRWRSRSSRDRFARVSGSAVPSWLRKIVVRGLSPAPGDRWPNMDELLSALRRDPARALRGWLIGAAAVAAVVAAFVAVGLARGKTHAPAVCATAPTRIAEVWNPGFQAGRAIACRHKARAIRRDMRAHRPQARSPHR